MESVDSNLSNTSQEFDESLDAETKPTERDSIMSNPPETSESDAEEVYITEEKKLVDRNLEQKPSLLPKYNKRAIPKDSETYMLENFNKNIMIVFNHEFVVGYEPRQGTNEDVMSLKRTFNQFRFEVVEHKDMLRKQVGEMMVKFSQTDFTDYGCVAIVILTHGSEKGGLRAKDKKYRESQILKLIKENPTLVTKPILYIIQACRGNRKVVLKDVSARKDNVQVFEQYKIPLEADTLVLHSTYDGYYSYRDETEGSWFIQTLCEKINKLADTEDVESIMTTVKREVALNKEEKVLKTSNEYEYNKQMPVTTSTLLRKLFLKRSETIENFDYPVNKEPSVFVSVSVRDAERFDSDLKAETASPQPIQSLDQMQCQICTLVALDRFDYMITCLKEYINENCADQIAKKLLILAKPYLCSTDSDDAKILIAKDIRDHLATAVNANKYNYLYIWKDF